MHCVGWQWKRRAMVFLEPVRAMATTSEPERIRGMVLLLPKFLNWWYNHARSIFGTF